MGCPSGVPRAKWLPLSGPPDHLMDDKLLFICHSKPAVTFLIWGPQVRILSGAPQQIFIRKPPFSRKAVKGARRLGRIQPASAISTVMPIAQSLFLENYRWQADVERLLIAIAGSDTYSEIHWFRSSKGETGTISQAYFSVKSPNLVRSQVGHIF